MLPKKEVEQLSRQHFQYGSMKESRNILFRATRIYYKKATEKLFSIGGGIIFSENNLIASASVKTFAFACRTMSV